MFADLGRERFQDEHTLLESDTRDTQPGNRIGSWPSIKLQKASNEQIDLKWLGDIFGSISSHSSQESFVETAWWECDFCGMAFASFEHATAHEAICSANHESQHRVQSCDLLPSEVTKSTAHVSKEEELLCSKVLNESAMSQNESMEFSIEPDQNLVVEVSTPLVQLFSRAQVLGLSSNPDDIDDVSNFGSPKEIQGRPPISGNQEILTKEIGAHLDRLASMEYFGNSDEAHLPQDMTMGDKENKLYYDSWEELKIDVDFFGEYVY